MALPACCAKLLDSTLRYQYKTFYIIHLTNFLESSQPLLRLDKDQAN